MSDSLDPRVDIGHVHLKVADIDRALGFYRDVLGIAPTSTGKGYWLYAQDGGIFAFGDAKFFGSAGALRQRPTRDERRTRRRRPRRPVGPARRSRR